TKKNGVEKYTYTSYGCTARVKYSSAEHGSMACDNELYPTEELEQYISDRVMNLHFTEFVTPQTSTGAIDKLLLENSELKKQKERILDLYLAEAIDKDTYTLRFDDINKRISKNLAVIDNEKQKLAKSPTVSIEYLKQRQREYPAATKKEKRRLLQLLIKHIVIDGKQISISWNVK
ncbi:MAG: hypothetical protein J1G38_05285, partial [Clostridiales bacterium]|nr:hypothetical protein [Clostridiales bacterium]